MLKDANTNKVQNTVLGIATKVKWWKNQMFDNVF